MAVMFRKPLFILIAFTRSGGGSRLARRKTKAKGTHSSHKNAEYFHSRFYEEFKASKRISRIQLNSFFYDSATGEGKFSSRRRRVGLSEILAKKRKGKRERADGRT